MRVWNMGSSQRMMSVMRHLPSGTVTLLFTDIEGSTALLRELGDRYASALSEHRRLLRSVFARHDGAEVDTQGDAFFYVFRLPSDAVAAAVEAQAALAPGEVRVRMGLHTGQPRVTEDGYIGLDVHMAARVCSAGHGGQVLLTEVTQSHVGAGTLDLGEHRLKDLPEPVWLFQLGDRRFPPLRSLSNTNLPVPASSFLGRAQELDEAQALLEGSRLLTVAGPGGTGKTRFAIELASRQLDRFPNGVFWVPLATLRDPALVIETTAQAVGATQELASHIADKRLLLLLDNFEQVADAAPSLSKLLSACPNLTLLVTSRETLRIEGEAEYLLPPLADDEGVALFCARTGMDPADSIGVLCRRLDGLPLAIELAAARAKLFTVEQLIERLGQRLDLLTGGRDVDPRQRTLRATIQWSHALLADPEKRLFARLAVFAGGCTFDAAEQVAAADPDTLQSLVEKSMVRRTNGRFWMLETIREFATERFEEASPDDTRRQHAEHYLALAEAFDEAVGAEVEELFPRLDPEWDNLRAVLEWSCRGGDGSIALRLSGALWRFWWDRGAVREGTTWYEAALAAGAGEPEELRARAIYGLANMALARQDSAEATRLLEQCLVVFRLVGDDLRVMRALNDLGISSHMRGDLVGARRFYEDSLALALAAGDERSVASTRVNLANMALEEDRLDDARRLLRDVVSTMRPLGNRAVVGTALQTLAVADLRQTDVRSAAANLRESISLSREVGDWRGIGHSLATAAAVLAAGAASVSAVRALAGCAALSEDSGFVLETVELSIYEQTRDDLRKTLGEAQFDQAWAEFENSSVEAIVEQVLNDLD